MRKGQPLLCTIVGDSLLQPFWPEGTGCARGFLSAMDAGWLIRYTRRRQGYGSAQDGARTVMMRGRRQIGAGQKLNLSCRDWMLGKKNPLKILAEREMTRYTAPCLVNIFMNTDQIHVHCSVRY